MRLPELRQPRITAKAFNLRAHNSRNDWLRVDDRALLQRIKRQQREGIEWRVVPWQRNLFGVHRSYLAMCEDGSLYAIFLSRRDRA